MEYHCGNMDGPRGNYTDWNISYKERQLLCDFIYVCNLKKKKEKNKHSRVTDI